MTTPITWKSGECPSALDKISGKLGIQPSADDIIGFKKVIKNIDMVAGFNHDHEPSDNWIHTNE